MQLNTSWQACESALTPIRVVFSNIWRTLGCQGLERNASQRPSKPRANRNRSPRVDTERNAAQCQFRFSVRTGLLMAEIDQDEQFYRDTESVAHPTLDDRQLALLEPLGARRILRPGEPIYKAGQRDVGLTVVLRGRVEVFDSHDGQEQILGTIGPRQFAGDVSALMGTAAVANVRGGAEESEILEVPAGRLRQALSELPGVSEPLVRAFIVRRQR